MQCQWHLYNPYWLWHSIVRPRQGEMGKAQSTARQIRSSPVVQQRVHDATRPKVDRTGRYSSDIVPYRTHALASIKLNECRFSVVREPPSREYLEKASKLDDGFGDRLKHVFVTSTHSVSTKIMTKNNSKFKDFRHSRSHHSLIMQSLIHFRTQI